MNQFATILLGFLLTTAGCLRAADHAKSTAVGVDQALAKLKAGNARFVTNAVTAGKPAGSRRADTAQAQHPFAIVIACADSRVAPELLFDQGIGDLFVIRTAGNLVDAYALGSIEYAVEHLGTRLIVILGHERCGAVGAAVDSPTAAGHVGDIVRDIRPAVEAVRNQKGDLRENSIKSNVARVAAKVSKDAALGDAAAAVRVVQAYYDLDTGVVSWLK